tara:strand:+ start:118 stop:444 length:327 start_codon:yes stop_codon:yes gene_type:complete
MSSERTVFKMYIKESCPFCVKAKDFIINDLQASLHTIDVTDRPHLHESIKDETGHKTVPAVFLGQNFIGGHDDLLEYASTTEGLVKILREEVFVLREQVEKLRVVKCA